jgi:hypothetical protein
MEFPVDEMRWVELKPISKGYTRSTMASIPICEAFGFGVGFRCHENTTAPEPTEEAQVVRAKFPNAVLNRLEAFWRETAHVASR